MPKAIKHAHTQLERDATPVEKPTEWRRASTSLAGVIRTSSHAGSKIGYNHFGGSKGANIDKAVTRTARANRGRMGHVPGQKRPAVYKKDARLKRQAAELRQQQAAEQKVSV